MRYGAMCESRQGASGEGASVIVSNRVLMIYSRLTLPMTCDIVDERLLRHLGMEFL